MKRTPLILSIIALVVALCAAVMAIVRPDFKKKPASEPTDITDTGKGIPPKMQKRIFSPGYTSKGRGWGLGLTLAKRIIQNYHRGKLFVKSSVIDQGTTMRIQLNAGN